MNNILVYCELEEKKAAEVSLELLSKGRRLADKLGCTLECTIFGKELSNFEKKVIPYGVDVVHLADDKRLAPYTTIPHTTLLVHLIEKEKPQIVLIGATSIGRDLGPRVSARCQVGLTADCTDLVIGDYMDSKTNQKYHQCNDCPYP